MNTISPEIVHSVVSLLARDIDEESLEREVFLLTNDRMLSRRLIDWIPEVFGILLVGHIAQVHLPSKFSAKAKNGKWHEFEFTVEPIVAVAFSIATDMVHAEPNDAFKSIASRSSMVSAVTRALESDESLEGATLSGPALIGIPAETYFPPAKSFWRRLLQ
jgi:hypothetical protein